MKTRMGTCVSAVMAVILAANMELMSCAGEESIGKSRLHKAGKHIFEEVEKGTSAPENQWDWNNGEYFLKVSSDGAKRYSEYYFTDVVGRELIITVESLNRIQVDLVYEGLLPDRVSSWTIDADATKTIVIQESDLDGHSEDKNYYFVVQSNPFGNSFTINCTFK